ncbi:hypothetical protein Vsou_18020 [Vulcanisaeta souniana JCM 11219]|uniref:Uncharacterized protein n=1 Tax=Vulcanisaeta souniana JCM 11219 TaxID=1293586 RepID=A0ABN6ST68_9CREN|nr:hypothetical protein Vsou_18020 [Vulcanisaeta souniana JCM 11219]
MSGLLPGLGDVVVGRLVVLSITVFSVLCLMIVLFLAVFLSASVRVVTGFLELVECLF